MQPESVSRKARAALVAVVIALVCAVGVLAAAPSADAGACAVGTLEGNQCVVVGPAPTLSSSGCPVSATVMFIAPDCFMLVAPSLSSACQLPLQVFGSVCRIENPYLGTPNVGMFDCNSIAPGLTDLVFTVGPDVYVSECIGQPVPVSVCNAPEIDDPNSSFCLSPIPPVPGLLVCATGYSLDAGRCVMYTSPDPAGLICSQGTLQGINCVVTGPAPTTPPPTCPATFDAPDCFDLIAPTTTASCQSPFQLFGASHCKVQNPFLGTPNVGSFDCTGFPGNVRDNAFTSSGVTYTESCTTPPTLSTSCGLLVTDPSGQCRVDVAFVTGPAVCLIGYMPTGSGCVRLVDPTAAPMFSAFSYYVPPPPAKVTMTFELACVTPTTVRFSAFVIETEGFARVDMITLNGSVALARPFDATGPFDLQVITAYPTDIIVLDGPTSLPAC